MLLLGVVLSIGILLWRADSSFEWSVPLEWQTYIGTWQARLGNKTHSLNYVWYIDRENCELEKNFWQLQMALPRLRKEFRVPLWIKVCVHPGIATGQKEIYLACLQRRFPEIEIYGCPLYGEKGDGGRI